MFRRPAVVLYLLLGLCSVGPFLGALRAGFVFDDKGAVVNNPVVQGTVPLSAVFSRDFWGRDARDEDSPRTYRPLAVLTLAFDRRTSHGQPWSFHLTNLLLHTLCVLVVYETLRRRFGQRTEVFLSAALFAVHAVHTENVASIVGRADMLGLLFGLMAYACARSRRKAVMLLTGPLLFLGLCSKETAFVPLLLTVAEAVLGLDDETDTLRQRILARAWALGSAALCVLPYLLLRHHAMHGLKVLINTGANPLIVAHGLGVRVRTAAALLSTALGVLVLPLNLSADYSWAQIRPADTWLRADVMIGLATALLLPLSAWFLRRRVTLCLGLLLFAMAYLPVANLLVLLPTIFAERLLYLPSLGFCLAVGSALAGLLRRHRTAGLLLVAGLLLGHSVRASARTNDWRDEKSLFTAAVATSPLSAMSHNNLGWMQEQERDFQGARQSFLMAVQISPDWWLPRKNLAIAEAMAGDPEAAHRHFQVLLTHHPECHDCVFAAVQFYLRYDQVLLAQEALQRYAASGRSRPEMVAELRRRIAAREATPTHPSSPP